MTKTSVHMSMTDPGLQGSSLILKIIEVTQSDKNKKGIIINGHSIGLLNEIIFSYFDILGCYDKLSTLEPSALLKVLSPCLALEKIYEIYHTLKNMSFFNPNMPSLKLNKTLVSDLLHQWEPGYSWELISDTFKELHEKFENNDKNSHKTQIHILATIIAIFNQLESHIGFDSEKKKDGVQALQDEIQELEDKIKALHEKVHLSQESDIREIAENILRKSIVKKDELQALKDEIQKLEDEIQALHEKVPLSQESDTKEIAENILRSIAQDAATQKIIRDITNDIKGCPPSLIKKIRLKLKETNLINESTQIIKKERSFFNLPMSHVFHITRLIHKLADDHPNTELNIHCYYSANHKDLEKIKEVFVKCDLLLPKGMGLTFHVYDPKKNQYTTDVLSITPQGGQYSQEMLQKLEDRIKARFKSGCEEISHDAINEELGEVLRDETPAYRASSRP